VALCDVGNEETPRKSGGFVEGMTGIVPPPTPLATASRAEPRGGGARPGRIGSYGIHTNAQPFRLRRHRWALEGMTGIEPALSAWEA